MDTTTVLVAALGLVATLTATWLTGRSQRRVDLDGRVLDAKLRVYGECSASLYEYQRATYNRVKARIEGKPNSFRDGLRQEAYRCNTRSRSAIGQVAILTGDEALRSALDSARESIGKFNHAEDEANLKRRQQMVVETLEHALKDARADLSRRLSK